MSTDPDAAEFALAADACLERVSSWLEDFDPDEVDYTSSDGVLKIEFPDGATFVLNRQTAARQVWFAAEARAWHFEQNPDGSWRSTKGGEDLLDSIAEAVGTKLGRKVEL
jgi:CyaY protein